MFQKFRCPLHQLFADLQVFLDEQRGEFIRHLHDDPRVVAFIRQTERLNVQHSPVVNDRDFDILSHIVNDVFNRFGLQVILIEVEFLNNFLEERAAEDLLLDGNQALFDGIRSDGFDEISRNLLGLH